MTKFYLFVRRYLTLFLILGAISSYAQKVVSGKITASDDGSGIPGVNILEKGTTNGTVSDAEGNYKMTVGDNATLIFSFIGYKSQELAAGAQTALNVVMSPDVTSLSEVVVIGYGEIQKKDATGALTNLGTKDFNKGVVMNPQDLLTGRMAGVQVTSNNGAPGSGATIRIRGGASLSASNDPLIIIDGFPVDTPPQAGTTGNLGTANPLASINPNDIESFTVLKDASATAIYGSRASNGVIIVTTKKGAKGKMKLTLNSTVSAGQPIKYVPVMSGDEFRALAADLKTRNIAGIDDAAIAKLGTSNTDWQREIFHTAISQDYNIGASGAIKEVPYRITYGYTDQQGILKTTDVKRNTVNINLTPTLLKGDLKLTIGAKGSNTISNFGDAAAVGNAVAFDPTQPVRDGDETYGGYFSWLSKGITNGTSNPVAMLNQTDNKGTSNRLIGNIQAEYRLPFLKELKVNVNAGIDLSKSDGHNYAPLDAGFQHSNLILNGRQNTYTSNNHSKLLDLYFNYVRQFGDHKIDATAGYGYQYWYRSGTNKDSSSVSPDPTPTVTFKTQNALVSFFGRLNYSYKGRYLLTATLRDDGSSRVAPQNRWGLFPSIAAAWRLKDENFLAGVNVLSDLKLRAGYGQTGQQDTQANYNAYLATYQSSNALAQYQLGNNFYTTLRPDAYDRNLQWETTATTNIGLDFGFMNDRLTGTVEVFQKNTTDLINKVNVANGTNFSNLLLTNVGSMVNKGFELTLNWVAVSKGDFTWNIGTNFTTISSKITKLNLTDDPTYPGVPWGGIGVGAYAQNQQVGHPAFSYYMYQQVYNPAGKPIEGLYVDRSGEGGVVSGNEHNKHYFKRPAPKALIGFNSRLSYKKFDFAFSSRLSLGNYVYNNVQSGRAFYNGAYSLGYFSNIPTQVHDTEFVSQQIYSDYYVQNASFFKLDNVSIGYRFENVFTEKLKARISFTVQNALIITNYKGIDPEVDGGIDNNLYPRPRTYLVGLNFTF